MYITATEVISEYCPTTRSIVLAETSQSSKSRRFGYESIGHQQHVEVSQDPCKLIKSAPAVSRSRGRHAGKNIVEADRSVL